MKSKYSRDEISWVSQDGKDWAVKDMTNDHLCRLIVYIDKRSLTHSFFAIKYKDYADFLREEVVLRKLEDHFKKTMGIDLYDKPVLVKEEVPKLKEVASLLGRYPYIPPPEEKTKK